MDHRENVRLLIAYYGLHGAIVRLAETVLDMSDEDEELSRDISQRYADMGQRLMRVARHAADIKDSKARPDGE